MDVVVSASEGRGVKKRSWLFFIGPLYITMAMFLYLFVLIGIGFASAIKAVHEQVQDDWKGKRASLRKVLIVIAGTVLQAVTIYLVVTL